MLQRYTSFIKGGIYNLWATRSIAERLRKELENKRTKKEIKSYRTKYSIFTGQPKIIDIKYEGPGNSKNLWATKRIVSKIIENQKQQINFEEY